MLKKFFLIVAGLILVMGAICFCISSFWFWQKGIPWILNRTLSGISIQDWVMDRREWQRTATLLVEGLRCTLRTQDDVYRLKVGTLGLENLDALFNKNKKLIMNMERGGAASDSLQVDDFGLRLVMKKNKKGGAVNEGHLSAKEIKMEDYRLTNIFGKISGDASSLKISDLTAGFYDGQISGEILLDYPGEITYSIRLDLRDVDVRKMKDVNPQLFTQIQGKFSGRMEAAGTPAEIRSLSADFSAAPGGQIKAALLKFLIDYLPRGSEDRRNLERLVKAGGDVILEEGTVTLQQLSAEALTSLIHLKSIKSNLDIHVDVNMNIEGGWQNLLQLHKKLIRSIDLSR